MLRAYVVAAALGVCAAVSVYSAAAQGILDRADCGFRVPLAGWADHGKVRTNAGDIYFVLTDEAASESLFRIGPVWEIPAAGSSSEAQVLASAGQLCLACARDPDHPLVWIDRFVDGSKIVSYTIHRAKVDTRDAYLYSFFILEKNVSAAAVWIRANINAWVTQSVVKERELILMDTVRGLVLTRPDPNCWH